jgi:hypothetical protein
MKDRGEKETQIQYMSWPKVPSWTNCLMKATPKAAPSKNPKAKIEKQSKYFLYFLQSGPMDIWQYRVLITFKLPYRVSPDFSPMVPSNCLDSSFSNSSCESCFIYSLYGYRI